MSASLEKTKTFLFCREQARAMTADVIRTFIAVDLPPSVLEGLGQVSFQLQEKLPDTPVRWVNYQKMHLTLKFLGDISKENIAMVEKILYSEAAKRQAMEIGIGGIGAFPKMRHPRVIWIGVEAPTILSGRIGRRLGGPSQSAGCV